MEASSLINLGDCKIDLWELEEANTYFGKAIRKSVNPSIEETCNFRLALSNSYLGLYDEALRFAEASYKNMSKTSLTPWQRGRRFLSLGVAYKRLGDFAKSLDLYDRAIVYAEQSNFLQVKAIAFYGLAEIFRDQAKFETALSLHLESIEILSKIGVINDLAEAYYQIGLTYQAVGEVEKSSKDFQEAVRLFSEMEAPKQVERVRQSMQN